MKPPKAKKIAKELTIHGDTRFDNYYWLNQREDQAVLDYLSQENAYAKHALKDTEQLQSDLYQEIVGRIQKDDESVPYKKNGFWYYTRFVKEGEYPIHCRKKGGTTFKQAGDEEILLDVNQLAEGKAFYAVGGLSVSPNNRYLVYGEDTVSRRIYTLKVKDLENGSLLDIEIKGTTGGATWAEDNRTLFYTERDQTTLRSAKIWSIDIHSHTTELRYHEVDETFNCGVYKSKSKKYIIIHSSASITSEFRYINATQPHVEFQVFQERIRGMEYGITHFQDKWYVLTNWDAQNFKLMEVSEKQTTREHWQEVISHREETLIEGVELFQNHMVVEEKTQGQNFLRIINQSSNEEHYMEFESETYDCWTSMNPEFDTAVLRFGYTSLTTPTSVFDYDLNTREKTLLKQQKILGGYNEDQYGSKRIWAESRDGTQVPMSMVFKKVGGDVPKDAPLLLYAYGSYGHSMDPYFSSVRLSLLDRGFVYVIAHVRGGEDLGRSWYEQGKLMHKKNTFYDFIDCGECLISEGYTSKQKLYAMGGSAGGLLVGAVINMRPDLWHGVIAAVPFVDVVTTMLDDSIPLTTGEYDEWGNPNEEAYYHYMKSYSPYDNVVRQNYPNLMITTGLHDSQVQYWEPAKWVAKLREHKTDQNLLILDCNMDTGHGGASGRFESLKETAKEYAFLLLLSGRH